MAKPARSRPAKRPATPAARARRPSARPAPKARPSKSKPSRPSKSARPSARPAPKKAQPPAPAPRRATTSGGKPAGTPATGPPVPAVVPPRPLGRTHVLSLSFLRDGDEFMARLETDSGQITELKNRSLDQLLTLVASELEDLLE
jgi:hypothetical protein